jgi:hypothetical protein
LSLGVSLGFGHWDLGFSAAQLIVAATRLYSALVIDSLYPKWD